MAGLEDTVAATALEAYADELAKSEDPRLHFNGKVVKVGFLIERLIGGQLKDPEPLESAVTELTRVPALIDLPSAMTLYQVYLRLEQYGYDGSSRKVREQIVAALKQNGAPQLQEIAATLEQNKRFDELGRVLRSVLAGQTTTTAEIKNAALKVAQELPDANTFNYLNSNALQFEAKEKYEVADLLYDVIAATVMKSGPPEVAKEADAVVRARDQRKLIIGKPITIQGLDLDRINVDWNGYQGKPVIVPFWSLRADTFIMFQKLHELMDRHGDKIKVLGVNLDGDEQPVLPFVTQARVRFPSIRQTDPNLQGVRDPLAQQVGVASQPYVLLVDAKGNVSSIVLELDRLDAAVDTLIK